MNIHNQFHTIPLIALAIYLFIVITNGRRIGNWSRLKANDRSSGIIGIRGMNKPFPTYIVHYAIYHKLMQTMYNQWCYHIEIPHRLREH